MVITAHQPNFLPGLSVTTKLAAADAILWLDDVDLPKNGWVNRNQLPDGTWLTVPVRKPRSGTPRIADAIIAETAKGTSWRAKMARTLRERYSGHDHYEDRFAQVIEANGSDSLLALNTQLLGLLLPTLRPVPPASYSQRALDEVDPIDADDISEWLAARCVRVANEIAGQRPDGPGLRPDEPVTYLSGPSGREYLRLDPFIEREVQVAYHRWDGDANPCCVDQLFKTGRVA